MHLLKIDVVLESMLYQLHYETAKSLILAYNISTVWMVIGLHIKELGMAACLCLKLIGQYNQYKIGHRQPQRHR